MTKARVLVVGDDATAWALGCLLVRAGVEVDCVPRVVGEAEQVGAPRFPLALRFPALELLQGLGLEDHLTRYGRPLARAEIVDRGGRSVTFDGKLPGHLCPGTSYAAPLLLDAARLEGALRARFLELGGHVAETAMLGAIATDARGVHVAVTRPDGTRATQRFAYVVDTTGVLRGWLGVHLELRHRARYFAASLEPDGENGVLRSYLGAGDTVAVAMPAPPGCARIGVASAGDAVPSRGAIQAAFRAAGAGSATPRPTSSVRVFESIEGIAPRFQEGRVLFAGRAAHVHGAPSVHGANLGFGDASGLAWRLARVVQGEAPAELLASYGVERRAVADALLRATARKRRLLHARPGASFSRREVLLSALEHAYVRERLAGRLIDLEGVGRARRPRGGEDVTIAARAADAACVSVPDGAPVRLHETTVGAHFTLLLFGAPTDRALAAVAATAREALGHAVGVVSITSTTSRGAPFADWTLFDARGEARDGYRVSGSTAVLVRPDGQVGFRGRPDPARLAAHLVEHRWVFAPTSEGARREAAGT